MKKNKGAPEHTKNEWITRIPIIHILPNHAKEYDFIYPLVIILIFLLNKIHTLKKKQWIYLKNDFQGKLTFLGVNILTDRETKTNDHNHFKIPELTISNDDTKWRTNIKTKHRTLPIEHFRSMVNEILVRERLSPTIPPEELCSIMQMWFLFSDEVLCSYILNITFYHGGATPTLPMNHNLQKVLIAPKLIKPQFPLKKFVRGGNFTTNTILFYDANTQWDIISNQWVYFLTSYKLSPILSSTSIYSLNMCIYI